MVAILWSKCKIKPPIEGLWDVSSYNYWNGIVCGTFLFAVYAPDGVWKTVGIAVWMIA
jgi:hypothetical protein